MSPQLKGRGPEPQFAGEIVGAGAAFTTLTGLGWVAALGAATHFDNLASYLRPVLHLADFGGLLRDATPLGAPSAERPDRSIGFLLPEAAGPGVIAAVLTARVVMSVLRSALAVRVAAGRATGTVSAPATAGPLEGRRRTIGGTMALPVEPGAAVGAKAPDWAKGSGAATFAGPVGFADAKGPETGAGLNRAMRLGVITFCARAATSRGATAWAASVPTEANIAAFMRNVNLRNMTETPAIQSPNGIPVGAADKPSVEK